MKKCKNLDFKEQEKTLFSVSRDEIFHLPTRNIC